MLGLQETVEGQQGDSEGFHLPQSQNSPSRIHSPLGPPPRHVHWE